MEAAAYFFVAEAITNITKHSEAHDASVLIDEVDASLRVVVEDDGQGGAHPEPSGLADLPVWLHASQQWMAPSS